MGEMSNNNDARRCMFLKMDQRCSSAGFDELCPPILNMAADHLFTILLLLPVDSLISLALTCKKLCCVATSDSLWEFICKREWGAASVDRLKTFVSAGTNQQSLLPWTKIYMLIAKLESISCYKLLVPDSASHVPEPRASHSLNLVSDCLVLFGGGCSGGRHLDDTWAAQIDNNNGRSLNWKKLQAGTPSGRFGHTCVVIGDCLVVFGGINDRGIRLNDTWIGQVVNDEKSSITLSWRLLNVGSIIPPARGAHAACYIHKRKMVIHGGIGINGLRLGDTWILDLSENLLFGSWWELATQSPPPCSGHSLTGIGEHKAVLFGGRGSGYEVLNDVWILQFSPGDLKWKQVPFDLQQVPCGTTLPRVGHTANVVMGDRLLIYGGEDAVRNRKNDFWLLDAADFRSKPSTSSKTATVMWKKLKIRGYRPHSRSFHRACPDRSGRYLFLFGGMVDGLLQPAESAGLTFDGEFFVVDLFSLLPKEQQV